MDIREGALLNKKIKNKFECRITKFKTNTKLKCLNAQNIAIIGIFQKTLCGFRSATYILWLNCLYKTWGSGHRPEPAWRSYKLEITVEP